MEREKLLEKIEEELNSLTQDELYDLLVSLGMKGLTKLKEGSKGYVKIIKEENDYVDM